MSCLNYHSKLKELYPHINDSHIDDIIGCAKECLIHLLYPSYLKVNAEQKATAENAYKFWLLRCMKDMISRMGMENVITYKENGLSITFDSSQISQELIKEIVPVMRASR